MIRTIKMYLIVAYYNVLRFFGYHQSDKVIPEGMYCYAPDVEKNNAKDKTDSAYYIIPCPYYKWVNSEVKACTYVGFIGFDFAFDDQCKICGEKDY